MGKMRCDREWKNRNEEGEFYFFCFNCSNNNIFPTNYILYLRCKMLVYIMQLMNCKWKFSQFTLLFSFIFIYFNENYFKSFKDFKNIFFSKHVNIKRLLNKMKLWNNWSAIMDASRNIRVSKKIGSYFSLTLIFS